MPDGSGRPSIEAEARAAAAEAAREAKAEVLDRAEQADASRRSRTKGKAPAKSLRKAKEGFQEFTIDVWITDFNSVEFGFWKRERNKGKSRQFTSDMDIYAEIVENGVRTGLLGYREDLWKKKSGMDKRLVLRLFGENLNWRGTMDLLIGRSLQMTIGAHGLPVVAFAANLVDYSYVTYVERSAHKWPLCPEDFSFFIIENRRPTFYRLRRDVIDLGGDYTLFDEQGVAIGRLDGRVFTLGGKWTCRVRKDRAEPRLMSILKLFGGMLAFNRSCRRHLKDLYYDVRAGRIVPKLETQEDDLYMNPRRVR
jgi:hypothetical protein